jgi:hypothetical protein
MGIRSRHRYVPMRITVLWCGGILVWWDHLIISLLWAQELLLALLEIARTHTHTVAWKLSVISTI